eukprot:snap_masked-scaffold_60-processed-gene-0.43-mRNA-1 protein AED:1.00 eAED:1.00 QI:0/-1/0/0/-1/1/1/0/148
MENINKILKNLREDDKFQHYLKDKLVRKALKHWLATGKDERLPVEEATELFNTHEGVIYVYNRLRELEHICKSSKPPVPFPLDAVLNKTDEIKLVTEEHPLSFDVRVKPEPFWAPIFREDIPLKPKIVAFLWSLQIVTISIIHPFLYF